MAAWLTKHADGARVAPRSRHRGVTGVELDGAGGRYLTVRVSAPPEAGKANAAVIKVPARRRRVPQRDLEVVSGVSARRKLVHVRGAPDVLVARLEALKGAAAGAVDPG